MPQRIGVFGGTFDPPHVGHLVTAVNVRHDLALDVVYLVVAGSPWQKEGTRVITPHEQAHRCPRCFFFASDHSSLAFRTPSWVEISAGTTSHHDS